MFFASDNWAGVHPDISANLSRHAAGIATAYGDGDLDRAVYRRFSEIFEREVAVFFVATGTAANALSMASLNRIGGVCLAWPIACSVRWPRPRTPFRKRIYAGTTPIATSSRSRERF